MVEHLGSDAQFYPTSLNDWYNSNGKFEEIFMSRTWLISIFSLLISPLVTTSPVMAHSVQTDYWMKAEVMEIQSTFSTGESLEGAPVSIYAPGVTQPWKEVITDKDGKFEFKPDASLPGNWTIKIGRGDHGDILTVPVGKEGVNIQLVSQNLMDKPHRHSILGQILVGAGVLTGGVGLLLAKRPAKG